MKIALIGTGIAGNVAAYFLRREHDITVFEAGDHIGGHTNTADVLWGGRRLAIDTGFIVYNDRTYPNFIRLLDELGVATQPSTMTFSVQCAQSGLEWNGSSLNGLFAQRRNLLRPGFHRMLRDVLRFNRAAPALLESGMRSKRLGEFLVAGRYSNEFIEHYLLPMGAAIWSAEPKSVLDMPAAFFVRFFHNHGLLQLRDRPQWRVITGGSRCYVEKLVAGHRSRIRLRTPVRAVRRHADSVEIHTDGHAPEHFDQVFFACHSDQALRLLADASPVEREVLGAIQYQTNEAVLHTDARLLPRRLRAWAAWNYHRLTDSDQGTRVAVTYNMNILQSLTSDTQFCVTLNASEQIDPDKILKRIDYAHPMFTPAAIVAQRRQRELNGVNRSYYCGAYWRYGFHEDGVVSALNALAHFRDRKRHEERHFRRAG